MNHRATSFLVLGDNINEKCVEGVVILLANMHK